MQAASNNSTHSDEHQWTQNQQYIVVAFNLSTINRQKLDNNFKPA